MAELDGALVGFAYAGPARSDLFDAGPDAGELLAINLIDRAKRRGLGRALFAAALGDVDAAAPFGLWVVTANAPARAFYKALGGREVAERWDDVPGGTVHETGYLWPRAADVLTA